MTITDKMPRPVLKLSFILQLIKKISIQKKKNHNIKSIDIY